MQLDEIRPELFIKSWIKFHSGVNAESDTDNEDYQPFLASLKSFLDEKPNELKVLEFYCVQSESFEI